MQRKARQTEVRGAQADMGEPPGCQVVAAWVRMRSRMGWGRERRCGPGRGGLGCGVDIEGGEVVV